MKAKNKKIDIVGLLVIMAIVFLCSFNIVYAYFTSTATVNGSLNFGALDIKFAYYSSTSTTTISGDTMTIVPNGSVSIGSTFTFKTPDTNANITYVGLSSNSSCSSYVALKLNAYKMKNEVADETVNYAEYFTLNSANNRISQNSTNKSIYYVINALGANTSFIDFAESLTLNQNAPTDLLNSSIQITITFKAVQQPNEAFKYEFGDWGYYANWS